MSNPAVKIQINQMQFAGLALIENAVFSLGALAQQLGNGLKLPTEAAIIVEAMQLIQKRHGELVTEHSRAIKIAQPSDVPLVTQ